MSEPFSSISSITGLSRQEFEKACTEHTAHYYLGNSLLLCRILTKYRIYLDGREVGVTPNILTDGYWESWITKFIAGIVQPGFICIDAGANFGYYSLMLAELCGKDGKTIAIEPNSHIAKLLFFTSKLNQHKFTVVQKALANKKSNLTLFVPPDFWGSGTIRKNKLEDHIEKEKIDADSMDNIVNELQLPRVDFIKMDCEGAEPMIFEGMKATLANNPGIKIVMEYSPFIYNNPFEFTQYLFNTFDVHVINAESQAVLYEKENINRLISLDDHIDLYLTLKKK
ncbi:MAG: FkbM family methyltransferase [Ferruginibacter sp.]|nr:FkbM family methyltransferase [Bacteroidota bacterium]MBX2919323.1 FkbM family methyltransferase [Ferruginibacter sp.]MCB0709603.1 FkbM family methyltransferase [Chitinophagaceae bacterium]MCC7380015.1 FkbM family methyltransferase [Chitinophagaceae bacterium]